MISASTALFTFCRAVLIVPVMAASTLLYPGTSSALSQYQHAPSAKEESKEPAANELERDLIQKGLISADLLDPSIIVDLEGASRDNFMVENLCRGLDRAYLVPEAAEELVLASRILQIN